jgi:hypothetical protein
MRAVVRPPPRERRGELGVAARQPWPRLGRQPTHRHGFVVLARHSRDGRTGDRVSRAVDVRGARVADRRSVARPALPRPAALRAGVRSDRWPTGALAAAGDALPRAGHHLPRGGLRDRRRELVATDERAARVRDRGRRHGRGLGGRRSEAGAGPQGGLRDPGRGRLLAQGGGGRSGPNGLRVRRRPRGAGTGHGSTPT